MISMITDTVGRYRVIRQIGSGGMGEVYLAEDRGLQRQVALKILASGDEKAKRRFVREAITASKLSHPNVAVVYEAGESENGTGFIAMQYVEGETLRDRLLRGPMPIDEVARIAREIADALDDAHRHGIVHRDIKPGNIMIDAGGRAKVLDFGIAKLVELDALATPDGSTAVAETTAGKFLGTLQYVSPEQAGGAAVDHRSDIFSLGVVINEMLTGTNPFAASTFLETIRRIREVAPPPIQRADCPAELKRIVAKCLEKNRERRYQSARDLVLDLERVAARAPRARPARMWAVALAVLSLILLAAGVLYFRQKRSAPALAAARVRTLAVLPFRPLGSGSGEDFLAVGMADAVITRLAQVHGFIVRPTSSVLKYSNSAIDPLTAGREQRVDSIVDGRVQHIGNRIRVSVQLLRVSDGSSIWAGHFDERFADVFDLQDAISERVATALVHSLTGQEHQRLTRRYTDNIEAYQLYLRGRYFWERRSVDSLRKSIAYYQQAIANDASYALAYAGLADSYNMLGAFSVLSPSEAYPKSKDAAAKALEIDPELAQADVAKSFATYLYDRDWNAAEAGFQRALAENPNYGPGHQWYAVCLVSRGRFDEARREIRRAVEVDPLSLIINSVVAWIDYLSRNPQGAKAAAQRVIEMDPSFPAAHNYLAQAYASLGRYDDAYAEFQKAGTLMGAVYLGHSGFVLAKGGHSSEARALLAQIQERSRRQYVSPYHEALVRLGLGQKQESITLLEQAADQHYPWAIHYSVEPMLDSLRNEPRFKALLQRLGLPDLSAQLTHGFVERFSQHAVLPFRSGEN
jgi:eukaryotic-like serine/threonine-protein kinase